MVVSLSEASPTVVTVAYATADGTATAGADYTAQAGTVTFAPGQTSRTILVSTLDDSQTESNETFFVNLSNPSGATISDFQGVGTIVDNDSPKFFVVDDASIDRTYRYASDGTAMGNTPLNSGSSPKSGSNTPRGITSNVAGTTVWVADANRRVYVYDAAGTALGNWTAGSVSQPEGIATNGTDLWIVDAQNDRVYRYANAAGRRDRSQDAASNFALAAGNTNPKGIVTDGASLWVVDDGATDRVFKYTLAGALVGSWTIDAANASPTGLTLNPTAPSDIWIVDNGTDRVYRYAAAAGVTTGGQSAASSFALAAGNTNPQDIADPPVPSGGVAGVSRLAVPPSPGIAVDWLTDDEDEYYYAPIDVTLPRS